MKLFWLSIALVVLTGTAFTQSLVDEDGDGIPDAWEKGCIQVTLPSGAKMTIDLKGQGATSNHKDIFVWIDWMQEAVTPPDQVAHTHRPLDSGLDIVRQTFEHAPISNPDGTTGIRVHFIVSPEPVPHQDNLGSGTESSIWDDFDKIKKSRFPPELEGIFHYCLFAHDIVIPGEFGVSGDSRSIPAYDFIVSLGEWYGHAGSEDEQAGTLMHELGHNLGLHHGGLDDVNGKPNYISVMNYMFQTDGFVVPAGTWRFDYSKLRLIDLDENSLDESVPLTSDSSLSAVGTRFFCPLDPTHPELAAKHPSRTVKSITGPVDWNCDNRFDHVVKGNISDNTSLGLIKLVNYTDWGVVSLTRPQGIHGVSHPVTVPASKELSLTQANTFLLPAVGNVRAVPLNNSVDLSWDPVVADRVVGYTITRTVSGVVTMFSTHKPSFEDVDIKSGKHVHYEVQALYVPHGAPLLIQRTGEKQNGEEVLSVGKDRRVTAPSKSLVDPKFFGQLSEEVKNNIDAASAIAMTTTAAGRSLPRDRSKDTVLQTEPTAIDVQLQ
jgi:hypothetical protein